MLFTIIVPVYNIEKYVGQCIESIISQDFSDYELILVDDGSTDSSSRICDQYKEHFDNIKVIHKVNGGLSDARNTGIYAAIGEYILFVDGDDIITKGSLTAIANCIYENRKKDIYFLECMKYYDSSNTTVGLEEGLDKTIFKLESEDLYLYIADLPKYPASAWNKAVNRTFLLDNRLYFKRGIFSEDLEWSARCFSVMNSAGYCDFPYYLYRQNRAGSITASIKKKNYVDIYHTFLFVVKTARSVDSKCKEKMLMSIAEYIFRFLVLHAHVLNECEKKKMSIILKKYSYVLGHRKDMKSRLISLVYNIFGFESCHKLLKIFMYIRSKCAQKKML